MRFNQTAAGSLACGGRYNAFSSFLGFQRREVLRVGERRDTSVTQSRCALRLVTVSGSDFSCNHMQ